MNRVTHRMNRRSFIRFTASSVVVVPFVGALVSRSADAADVAKESDPIASALSYKIDATKAANRLDKNAVCSNCNLYTGKPDAPEGPCSIFGGKLVSAKGWCTGWVKKA